MSTNNIKSNPSLEKSKFDVELCNDNMTFSDCELSILRNAVEESEKILGEELINNDETRKIIDIVEKFLIRKKLLCYGGTAINNVLPHDAQFYDYSMEIPDYDFYSNNSLNDAIELADIYFKNGFKDVEAKSGKHKGTFKVFVNFIPIADITYMNKVLFNNLLRDSIVKNGIHYVPVNFLRMGVYLELSRPKGDISRWEKVTKRLNLLNEYYPFNEMDCKQVDFTTNVTDLQSKDTTKYKEYILVRDTLIKNGVVFFGGFARNIYSKYIKNKDKQNKLKSEPVFDVLSEDIIKTAKELKKVLEENDISNVILEKHEAYGELIPEYVKVTVDDEPIVFIYSPIACHSYNEVEIGTQVVKIATIYTMLTFYLTFIYANKSHYNQDRLFCMAKYLFELQSKNRLTRKGVLKHYSIDCYGEQESLEDILAIRSEKFKELKKDQDSDEYKQWFLKYEPANKNKNIKIKKQKTPKKSVVEIINSKPTKDSTNVEKTQKTQKTKRKTSKTSPKKTLKTKILERSKKNTYLV
jgi:hypothetical protein